MNRGLQPENGVDSYRQLFRFAIVGILSNFAGYIIYLMMTSFGSSPKFSMSLLYGIGATIGFFGNFHFTFAHQGSIFGAGNRFIISYIIGYLLNLCILVVFVDNLGFDHRLVQGIAIFVVAAFLFFAFKLFAFPVSKIDEL